MTAGQRAAIAVALVLVAGWLITLLWMLAKGRTPSRWGLSRPWTSEEYLFVPLGWIGLAFRTIVRLFSKANP